jgi:hypothetical protein
MNRGVPCALYAQLRCDKSGPREAIHGTQEKHTAGCLSEVTLVHQKENEHEIRLQKYPFAPQETHHFNHG